MKVTSHFRSNPLEEFATLLALELASNDDALAASM
jgi:hypothetical protein